MRQFDLRNSFHWATRLNGFNRCIQNVMAAAAMLCAIGEKALIIFLLSSKLTVTKATIETAANLHRRLTCVATCEFESKHAINNLCCKSVKNLYSQLRKCDFS